MCSIRSFCLLGALLYFQEANAQIIFPPSFGHQTDGNQYRSELALIYEQTFEYEVDGVQFLSSDVQVAEGSGLEISGARSARFLGPVTAMVFDAAENKMEPNSIYQIEFDYAVLALGSAGSFAIGVGFEWGGLTTTAPGNVAGPTNADTVPSGRFRRQIRTGSDPSISMILTNFGAQVIVDNIRIYKVTSRLERAEPPIHKALFPRLGNYNLYSSFETALRNGNVSTAEVESTLGLFDLVTGYQIDHTLVPTDAGRQLRKINPNILILPYHQTFVAQYDGTLPFANTAGMLKLFNRGLQDAWFMKKPDGTLLEEPLFPDHFQMNHTSFSPQVDGYDFVRYSIDYLSKTIAPSGLWDGIHFDQSEWYPNPLLSATNPFLEEPGSLPPIDLDNDGNAETDAELDAAWRTSFYIFFDALHRQFGYTQILFGNAGEIATQPSVLSRLNGFQREFLIPYDIDSNGDFSLQSSTKWHDVMRRYQIAQVHLREPQILNFQFTGYKLGVATGDFTENGLADREPVLEPRDYQRMRLGLTTVLMGDGFFGYDFVDNTTLPIWFDEYAVRNDGTPAATLSAKGYLGQPLGQAFEVFGATNETVFFVDFEQPSQFPAGTDIANYTPTSVSNEVVNGAVSVVFSSSTLLEGDSMLAIYSNPAQFPLDTNTDYQLLLDYRILSTEPGALPNGFFSLGIQDPAMTPAEAASSRAVIWDPDVGASGTLRVSTRTKGPNATLLAFLHSNGSIAVDNIRLVKGKGGVFRRDFENGIALVNPTTGPFTLSQGEVAGSLNRTNVRRISGVQDPITNDGSPVTDGITIPAADGIILLANRVPAAPAQVPPVPLAFIDGTSATLYWSPAAGTVAGYLVEYGLDGGDLADFALANKRWPIVTLSDLEPGTMYRARVASYNYAGVRSTFSDEVTFTVPGGPVQRPQLSYVAPLVRGQMADLIGVNLSFSSGSVSDPPFPMELSGVSVLINDVAVPVALVESEHIQFFVPDEIAGASATVEVVRNGVRSPARIVQVVNGGFSGLDASSLWTLSGAVLLIGMTAAFALGKPFSKAK